MVKDCSICCDKFNKTSRKEVLCGFCNHSACRSCIRTYLLGTVNAPHCMQCKVQWSMDKMWEEFPKSFIDTELRKHQETLLLEREKARLPEAQQEIFVENQTRLYNSLQQTRRLCLEYGHTTELSTLQGMLREIEQRLGGAPVATGTASSQMLRKRDNFQAICPCPKEGCRGYIQKASHTCGLCNAVVCEKCRATKEGGVEHTCKPEDIETVKALKKDTKPCPSCGTPLMKVDGCDQVWALCCKKAFSWRTGEFETKVHALDYLNYLRRAGRPVPRADEPGVQPPCNPADIPGTLTVMNALTRGKINGPVVDELSNMNRGLIHNQANVPMKYTDLVRVFVDPNFHAGLRRDYLLGKITEEEWQRRLLLFERKRERQEALTNVYNLFMQTSRELMNEIVRTPGKANENLHALKTLKEYCNECFANVTRRYNVTPYVIGNNFQITRKATVVEK